MAHQNEVPSFGGFRGSRPEDITQWVKLVGAGSSKSHGSIIHGNTPYNQCARSVLVSFMSSFTALSMLSALNHAVVILLCSAGVPCKMLRCQSI